MLGKPKHKQNDTVRFLHADSGEIVSVTGKVEVVDAWGTFEQNEEPSYDIFVEEENCLYKHIPESHIIGVEK